MPARIRLALLDAACSIAIWEGLSKESCIEDCRVGYMVFMLCSALGIVDEKTVWAKSSNWRAREFCLDGDPEKVCCILWAMLEGVVVWPW